MCNHFQFLSSKKISYFALNITFTLSLTLLVGVKASYAQGIRDYQTTRLKSTAGAGVGSVLMDEATTLNPASLGLYTVSSAYYQQNKGNYNIDDFSDFKDRAIVLSDSKGSTGGSFSHIKQTAGEEKRKTIGLALAAPFRKNSSFGVSYRRISEDLLLDDELTSESYNEFSVGVTHALGPHFSYGVLVEDPFKKRNDDSFVTLGFHYLFHEYIAVMLDMGGDYTNDFTDTFAYAAALQVMFFNDFYLRGGYFNDDGKNEKGTGFGLSWVGPKLVFEFALKNTEVRLDQPTNRSVDISEASFSLAYQF